MARPSLELTAREFAMVEGTWPMELILDDARQPLVASSATDFAMRVLFSDHLEDVVVFRGGADALGLSAEDCLPRWLLESLEAFGLFPSSPLNVLLQRKFSKMHLRTPRRVR